MLAESRFGGLKPKLCIGEALCVVCLVLLNLGQIRLFGIVQMRPNIGGRVFFLSFSPKPPAKPMRKHKPDYPETEWGQSVVLSLTCVRHLDPVSDHKICNKYTIN